jgi:redox-sensitive bicupin YhaK (pirin superfamily)
MQLLNRMIGTLMVGTVLLATATTAAAQEHLGGATTVARRAADLWNAQASLRVNGSYSLDEGKSSDGTVAVINGPITVNGTIRGTLVAINADVRLSRSARIERDLIVIGGTITGRESASVGGELVQQDELIRYHLDDGQLQIDR